MQGKYYPPNDSIDSLSYAYRLLGYAENNSFMAT